MKIYTRFVILLTLCSFGLIPAYGQHYTLDTNFQYKGIDTFAGNIATGVIHRPKFVLPQPDNKILIAGYIAYATSTELMRLKYDGTFDSTFNDSGKVVTTHSYIQSGPAAAIIYDTSKILTASEWLDISSGWVYMAIYNYNSNGSLNAAFGSGGISMIGLTTFPVFSTPIGLGAQTDGKFIVMGSTPDPLGITQYGLVRLLSNGTVDGSYGTGGRTLDPYPLLATPPYPGSPVAGMGRCCTMQPDNKFVIAGMFADSLAKYGGNQLFVVRHNMDGSPDYTFGEASGMTIIKDSSESYEITAMGTDGAGNLYVFAYFNRYEAPFVPYNYVVIKLDHNGHRVNSYGTNGIAYLQIPIVGASSSGFAVQKDGKAIIPGVYRTYTPTFMDRFVLIRLDTLGDFDTSFNAGGQIVTTRDSTGRDLSINAGVQPDGKILVIGWDTLSATSICMRFTNYHNLLPLTAQNAIPDNHPAFTGYVFPNPIYSKDLHIHYSNSGKSNMGVLQLYDATGRAIDSRAQYLLSGDGDISYSLPSITQPGMYYVILQNDLGQRQVHPVTVLR